jgi:hypothetical protein
MNGMAAKWLAAIALVVGLASSASAAFPFPPYQCPWHEAEDCPKSKYCCLHYWTPKIYRLKAFHTTPRYVYGCPTDPELSGVRITAYPCRAVSPEERAIEYLEVGRQKNEPDAGADNSAVPGAPAAGPEKPIAPAAPGTK